MKIILFIIFFGDKKLGTKKILFGEKIFMGTNKLNDIFSELIKLN